MAKVTKLHQEACTNYKRAYYEKNGHLACEVCGRGNAFRYQTHHIYYASRFPRHKHLHNPKNLILVCETCHEKFHSGELYDMFLELEAFRGLKALFYGQEEE